MKVFNILWLVDHLGYDGIMHGAGKYYLNTIPAVDKTKFNITLCVLRERDHLTNLFEEAKINITHLGKQKYDPLIFISLINFIKNGKFDLIHSHGYGSDNFGRIIGKILRIPTIIHAHDENRSYPVVQNIADLLLVPFTDKAIAVSQGVKESCINKRRIRKQKIFVLHNGIPLKNFTKLDEKLIDEEKRRFGIKPDSIVLGTVARLRKEKGLKYLIQSAPRILNSFPNVVFFIAGDGPIREELETLAKDLAVDNKIIFAGFCNNIPMVLSLIDIFVAPSLTEGSPLGIFEAMAMGKPIIASNVGGIREILKDKENSLLVPSEDPERLAEKILFLLNNKNEMTLLGLKAFEESKKYDNQFLIKNLEDIYSELLKK
jgi:glycosyltransferase involved in cell wall biosynthesis